MEYFEHRHLRVNHTPIFSFPFVRRAAGLGTASPKALTRNAKSKKAGGEQEKRGWLRRCHRRGYAHQVWVDVGRGRGGIKVDGYQIVDVILILCRKMFWHLIKARKSNEIFEASYSCLRMYFCRNTKVLIWSVFLLRFIAKLFLWVVFSVISWKLSHWWSFWRFL